MTSLMRILSLLTVVSMAVSQDFASQLRKCRVNDHIALNACLHQTLEDLRPRLRTGIPELGLPALEPMKVENLLFRQQDGAVSIESAFMDVTITGLSRFNATFINADPVSRDLEVSLFIPQLKINGRYNLRGQVFILGITGNGPFNANLNGVNVNSLGKVNVYTGPSGNDQLRISGTNIDFNINRVTIRLENLFNGDPILGETVNHFLNENSQEILRDLKPEIIRQLSELVERVMNDALSQLPVNSFLV